MADAVVIDAGPLVLLARGDAAAVEWLEEAVDRETQLLCAGATYAEVWRGHSRSPSAGQQAIRLARALQSMTCVPTDQTIGLGAGQLLAVAGIGGGHTLTLDAIVVATAVVAGASVLTGDPNDIGRLAVPAGVLVMSLPIARGTPPPKRSKPKNKRRGNR